MTVTSKTVQITTRVPHELYDKICNLCRSTTATQTDVVINALTHYLNEVPFTDLPDDSDSCAKKQDVKILFNLVKSYQNVVTRDNEAHLKRLDYLDGQIEKLWKAVNNC